MKIETYIDALVSYAMNTGLAEPEDHIVLVNRLIDLLGKPDYEPSDEPQSEDLEEILAGILDYAAIGILFPLLHRFIDRRRDRYLIQKQDLEHAKPQDIQHNRLQLFDRTVQARLYLKVQQHPVLQNTIAQPAGQSSIPPVKLIPDNIFF